MSNFLDHIETELTGRQFPYRTPVSQCFVEEMVAATPEPYNTRVEVHYKMNYQMVGLCAPMEVPGLRENFRMRVRGEVYGELFTQLLELEAASFGGDRQEIREKVKEMMVEMGYDR